MIVNQEHILKIMSKENTREVVFLLIGSSLFAGGAIVFLFMGPAQELNEYFRRSEGRAKRGPELLVYIYIYEIILWMAKSRNFDPGKTGFFQTQLFAGFWNKRTGHFPNI